MLTRLKRANRPTELGNGLGIVDLSKATVTISTTHFSVFLLCADTVTPNWVPPSRTELTLQSILFFISLRSSKKGGGGGS